MPHQRYLNLKTLTADPGHNGFELAIGREAYLKLSGLLPTNASNQYYFL